MTADAVAERTATAVRPHDLLRADQDVEFDDLVALAKVFKRPWSYLLIDTPEVYPSTGSDNRTHANRMVALSPELIAELQMVDLMLDAAADLFPRGDTVRRRSQEISWPPTWLRVSGHSLAFQLMISWQR